MVKSVFLSEPIGTKAAPAQEFHTVNIVIDVQDPHPPPKDAPAGPVRKGLDDQQREEYLQAVKDTIEEFKARGIQTIYVAIGDSSELYPGTRSQPDAHRDPALLEKLGLKSLAPGPEDDLVQKRFMDTFTDIADVRASKERENYIAGQRDGNTLTQDGNIEGASFGRPTFLEHLKKLGIKNVTIMGSMAEFCITDNALGATTNGITATVLSDRVIGWQDDNCMQAVWHKDEPEKHTASIKAKLEEVRQDPVGRGFKASDAEMVDKAIGKIAIRTSEDVLAGIPVQKTKFQSTGPAESKHSFGGEADGYSRNAAPKMDAATPARPQQASHNRSLPRPGR